MERKDAKVEKEEAEKYRNLQTEIVSVMIMAYKSVWQQNYK